MAIRCPLCGFLLRSDKISSLHLVTEDKEVTRNQLKVMMMVMMMVSVMAMMTIMMVMIMRTLHLHLKLKLMIPVKKSYFTFMMPPLLKSMLSIFTCVSVQCSCICRSTIIRNTRQIFIQNIIPGAVVTCDFGDCSVLP